MKEYNISALITIMMNAFADSQVNTGSILLQTVASHPNVNVDVDGKMVSNLMKRKTDIHGDIKSGAGKKEVIDFARNKVKETILSRINPVLIDDTCSDILKTMSTDSKVSDGFCSKMQQLYESQNMLDFFTNAVLYALSVTNLPPEASVQEGDFMLLAEADYQCPIDGAKLWKKVKGNYSYVYQIVKIYPENIDDELSKDFTAIQARPRDLDMDDNKICLCKECAEDYVDNPTAEKYRELLELKKAIVCGQKRKQIAIESNIDDEIVDMIKAIANMDEKTVLQPFTEALEIKDKISPGNVLLKKAINDDVIMYYPFIEKQFSLLDGVEGATFNIIRSEVTTCYEKYEREGLDQNDIYNSLVDWLIQAKGLTDRHRTAASVMVSFFVQNCDVFKKREITAIDKETDEE